MLAVDSCKHVHLHSGLNASSFFACSHHSLSALSQASSAVPVIACSASSQAEGQFLSSELISSQDVSQQARELTTFPEWAMQRSASAVKQPLPMQESARIFTSPLHRGAACHAALLVSWI